MGHGDELVLADADFPAATFSKRVVCADGLNITTLLEAILPFFPLDPFVEKPVMTMDYHAWSKEEPGSYAMFRETIRKFHKEFVDFEYIERFKFYERAKNAFAVVATGEPDGNIILKKGVVAA